ncbi:MAG TPA: carboxypeptidase regulatory-like domain-containing protein [Bacteroidetes bacterium]|jgi:hypothetical protein|uniref:Carboxypeptidase regulatory-like domain-containing protein n=1 Tax=candidate division TA06 bacterium TaxID=2250710 RepID=A0A660SBM7_UNCT6|nr:MAG: hypothetical protein DRP44_00060 [candidate division TA06 bacterium]HHD82674.1 carboxypeptidase regulatory-like domain-containing protein [Bacteroidota bacterium]
MKKLTIFLLFSILLLINSCDIQPISVPNNRIYGTLSCNDGTSPVGAIVSLETSAGFPLSTYSVSSLDGYFSFDNLSSGDYKIYASLDINSDGVDDYSGTYGGDSSKIATLFGADTLSINIVLKRIVTYAKNSLGSRNR